MLAQRIFKGIFKTIGIIIIVLLVLSIPWRVKVSILEEISRTQYYLSIANLRLEWFEEPLLLGSSIIMALISATISFGFLFFCGFLLGWHSKKNEFVTGLWGDKISKVDGFTFVPFPEDIEANMNLEEDDYSDYYFFQRKNRYIVIPPPIVPANLKKSVALTVIIFLVMAIKDYFVIEDGDFYPYPLLHFFGDIFLIGISFILGCNIGSNLFKNRLTYYPIVTHRYKYYDRCIWVPLWDYIFVCPQVRFDKFSIKDAEKVYETYRNKSREGEKDVHK